MIRRSVTALGGTAALAAVLAAALLYFSDHPQAQQDGASQGATTVASSSTPQRQAPPAGQPTSPQRQNPPVPAQPQQQATPQQAQLDRSSISALVRSTLLALQHANETGNYTVFRDLGAPGFQTANSAARLGEIFASIRAQNLDIAAITAAEPQFSGAPRVDERGNLRVDGAFPAGPNPLQFRLVYVPVEGRWRLFGISVGQSPVAVNPAQ